MDKDKLNCQLIIILPSPTPPSRRGIVIPYVKLCGGNLWPRRRVLPNSG